MFESPLAPWRDVSLILLSVEAALLCLLPAIALYYTTRGVNWTLRKARLPFERMRDRMHAAQQFVDATASRVVAPFVAARSLVAGVRAGLCILWDRQISSTAKRTKEGEVKIADTN